MNDMRNPLHGGAYDLSIRDAPFYFLQPLMRLKESIVKQRPNRCIEMIFRLQNAIDEMATNFAGCASYQDAFHMICHSIAMPSFAVTEVGGEFTENWDETVALRRERLSG